ncbi:glioma pathogenesis-related protein 1-like isoform X2 [Ornithorhynchus anatinus]|uniref:glioma pathogenesis-related protein 1-like isoform X2 n=1 Tax=Ornithorhynchus anatinus TaxID=9258 RepID=UPI0010A835C4|nr:glioma pathogenesis-related protein 1-like isoform X2 [Ornithorhynchus anatinus]
MILGTWLAMEMRLGVIAFSVFSICGYSDKEDSLPDIENEDFIKDCVQIHNKLRSEVNPPASNMLYMTWDPDLAKTARAWVKTCQFKHNTDLKEAKKFHPSFSSVGENIWTGSLRLFSVSSAIQNWYNEVHHYTYETHYCSGVCGHYTQVVWATSYKVGCAVQFCPQVFGHKGLTNAAHFICNYGPRRLQLESGLGIIHPESDPRFCPHRYFNISGPVDRSFHFGKIIQAGQMRESHR